MRLRGSACIFLVCSFSSFLGCATAERHLRSQPASYFAAPVIHPAGTLKDLVEIKCSKERNEETKECLYISADISRLLDRLPESGAESELRESVLDLLLGISDYNCSNFLHRAFAVRSTLDGSSKLISDLASAVSAGTVTAAPGLSAGLDALNLLVGKTDQTFNATFYFENTFQALEAAIAAERTRRRTEILARRETEGYSLMDALSDARRYDDFCSIKMGLQSLQKLAEKEKQSQEMVMQAVENKDPQERPETLQMMNRELNIPPS